MSAFPPPHLKYRLALAKVRQRRLARRALWRSCVLIGCTLGIGLAANLPHSKIEHQTQIEIEGTKLVSEDTIYTALDIAYPQFFWMVNGIDWTQKIESIPSIEAAQVNRQALPPRIKISLQEKIPVAVATSQGTIGFIDRHGDWIPQEFYAAINDRTLPKLKVIDYNLQAKQTWNKIYQLINLYPELQINEVSFERSGNLFVNSKIGKVFLGSETSLLERQFKVLARLQNLPQHLKHSEIDYIDLSNPESNLIHKY